MNYHCTLDPDINNCQYYLKKGHLCLSEKTECSFRQKEVVIEQTERKTKWFEKYMK